MGISNAIKRFKKFITKDNNTVVDQQNTDDNKKNVAKTEEKIKVNSSEYGNSNKALRNQTLKYEKSNNSKKKKKIKVAKVQEVVKDQEEGFTEPKKNYDEIINKYKKEIESTPQESLNNKRNLLAFAYYKSGRIEETRKELLSMIEQNDNYIAYRQLIHLEKEQGNLDDAKLWAYEGIEKFPDSIHIRNNNLKKAKTIIFCIIIIFFV